MGERYRPAAHACLSRARARNRTVSCGRHRVGAMFVASLPALSKAGSAPPPPLPPRHWRLDRSRPELGAPRNAAGRGILADLCGTTRAMPCSENRMAKSGLVQTKPPFPQLGSCGQNASARRRKVRDRGSTMRLTRTRIKMQRSPPIEHDTIFIIPSAAQRHE